MKDMTKTERKVIIGRILQRLEKADDKTLREIERLVIGWMRLRREQKMSESL